MPSRSDKNRSSPVLAASVFLQDVPCARAAFADFVVIADRSVKHSIAAVNRARVRFLGLLGLSLAPVPRDESQQVIDKDAVPSGTRWRALQLAVDSGNRRAKPDVRFEPACKADDGVANNDDEAPTLMERRHGEHVVSSLSALASGAWSAGDGGS